MKTEQTFEDFLEEVKKDAPEFVASMGVEYFKDVWKTQRVVQAQTLAVRKAFTECTTTKGCLADFKNLDPTTSDASKMFIDYTVRCFEQTLLATLEIASEKIPFKIYAGPGVVSYLKLLRSFHLEPENPLGVYKEGYFGVGAGPVYVYKTPPKIIDPNYILIEYTDGTFAKYLLDGLEEYYERRVEVRKATYTTSDDFEGKELGEVCITKENKILRDKFKSYKPLQKSKGILFLIVTLMELLLGIPF